MSGRLGRMFGMRGLLRMALVMMGLSCLGTVSLVPSSAAAVAPLNAWTNISSTAPGNLSGTVAAGNLTVSAGSNRLFLAGVCLESSGVPTGPPSLSATLGGVALTPIGMASGNNRESCWVGRLSEAEVAALTYPAALSVTYNAGASRTASSLHVKWASYSGIDQTTPVNSSSASSTAAVSVTFGAIINYVSGGQTFYVAGNGGAAATVTNVAGFTTVGAVTTGVQSSVASQSAVHGADGSYPSGGASTVTFAGTTSAWSSLVVASLKPATATAPGTVLANPGAEKISVVAPYSGDDDGDNTLTAKWVLAGGDFGTPLGSQVVAHQSSPYSYIITGLANGTAYDVQVTYTDPDGVYPTAVQALLNITPANFMLHNSQTVTSTKWGASGWGIAGGRYGAFSCATCHVKNSTPNIKRIKGALTSGTADPFPIQAGAGTISFLDARDGTSTFGTDAGGHLTSSKICEGCHSLTSYHRYNTTGQIDLNHYNSADCMVCHKHSEGFKPAGCNGCHGSTVTGQFWPDGVGGNPAYADDSAGAHANHVEAISTYLGYGNLATLLAAADTSAKQKAICAFCHPDPGGGGHTANGGSDSRVDVATAGNFRKYTGSGASALDTTSAAYSYATASCATLVCHNRVTTPSGANNWNVPPAAPTCALCHTTNGGSQRHDVHVGTKGYACTQCHTNIGTFPTGTGAPLRHGDGLVQLVWNNAGSFENSFGGGAVTYSQVAPLPYLDATWGTCASAACHNNKTTPAWNAALTGACTICHVNVSADATHTSHTGAAATYGRSITCASCHEAATTSTTPPASGHINGTFSVAGSVTFTYTGTYPTKGTCNTNVCHNNGTSITAGTPARAYTWGTALADDCASCHLAIPPSTEAHNEHMSNGYTGAACIDCHTAATNANHMGGTVSLDTGKVTYSAATAGSVVLRASAAKTGTCATASCHNRGTPVTASAAWNTAGDLACDACHYSGTSGAANQAYAMKLTSSHSDHFTAGKLCTQCHGATPTTTAHISATSKAGGLASGATALQDRATLDWTHASSLTDYTLGADNSCYSGTNNGLGCHATAGATGAADGTRLIWTNTFNTLNVATECIKCHTNTSTAAVNPTSGLHGITPLVSEKIHNQTLSASGCAACHTTLTAQSTHANGLFQGGNGQKTQMGLPAFYTQTADNTGTCAATSCHLSFSDDWAHVWTNTASYYTTNTTACAGCHGDKTSGFNAGVLHRSRGPHTSGTTYGCASCHVLEDGGYAFTWSTNDWRPAAGDTTTLHGDGNVQVNSNGITYNAGTGLCTTCHTSSDGIHNFLDTSWPIVNLNGSTITCVSCHTGSGSGGLKVGSGSTHVIRGTKAGMNTFNDCSNCHPMHTGGVMVPNNAAVGISYTADGRTGFRLGGTATTGTTEAEICWNCHSNTATYQTTAISEWGANNKQTGAPAALVAYNYGTVSTPNWTSATWTSAESTLFAYKTGTIQSTHSANSAGTSTVTTTGGYYTETKDSVANIRCSYCHDVHNTASGVVTGDVSGKPFLRGTWWTNPYREDGAPTGAYNYYSTTPVYGAVPRGYSATPSVNATSLGGWQIDQNNSNPTVASGYTGVDWTMTNSAGLCVLCHGNTVNTMNWNTGEANLWIGTNGHANAVIGGDGTGRANIYSPATRNEGTSVTNPKMGYQLGNTARLYGVRNNAGNANVTSDGTTFITATNSVGVYPYAGVGATAQVRYAYQTSTGAGNTGVWGVDQSTTTAQTKYHNFSCSKCHNPHASRLPKLMITNCLDVSHSTWDNTFSVDPDWTAGQSNGTPTNWSTVGIFPTGTETAGNNKQFAYAKSAQNCHRFIDNNGNGTITTGDAGGDEPGWNKVTPWK